MITIEQANRIEKNQERILSMLHKVLGNIPENKEWGTYEDACKILNRSKEWYKKIRNGHSYSGSNGKQLLVEGVDWRYVGNQIQYRMSSIQNLYESLANNRRA